MRSFAMAHASGADTDAVLEDCVRRFGRHSDPGIGLVFTNSEFHNQQPRLLQRLREATGMERWFGGVGLGVCATGCEYYDEPALALMRLEVAADQVWPIGGAAPLEPLEDEAVQRLAGGLGLLFLDPGRADATDWLAQVSAAAPDCFMVGGMGRPESPSGDPALRGHAGLLFTPGCEVLVDHTQGCSLIGQVHEITRAFRNIVVELDGRPALQVLEAEIGEVLARDLQRALGYIFAALPVSGQDRSDYQIRNIVGVDRQHQLIAIGDVPREGQRLQFARRDGNSARDDLEQMLVRLRRRAGRKAPRGAVYVSCIGRGRNQFGDGSVELRMISDALGEVPLAGFFAGGEIYQSRIYAYTGVLILFL